MRVAGSKSWRVSVDRQDQALHVALCIRDHFQIHVTEDDVPPSLNWHVPTGQVPFEVQNLDDFSGQWLWWWRQLVHASSCRQLELDLTGFNGLSNFQDPKGGTGFFDPYEDFHSLDSRPQLRDLVAGSWRQGIEWSKPLYQTSRERARMVVKDVVDTVIAERQVLPESINASVIVLSVRDGWFMIAYPGVLLCSESTYADDSRFAVELRKSIESSLDGPRR